MLCNCVELTGNKRLRIRWPQVGVYVRGLVVYPIVCGENRQMNNQPAVSLESTTIYHNLPSSPFWPHLSRFLYATFSLSSTQKLCLLNLIHAFTGPHVFTVYCMIHFYLLSNLCSLFSSPASVITPYSLFATPLLILFLSPFHLQYVPSRQYERGLL